MLSESEALARILDTVVPLPSRAVPLGEAQGRFAAKTLHASVPLPGFDNSAMDGYALRAVESRSRQPLRVTGEQSAGPSLHLSVEPGTAVRIFTGAPMPAGADAVIMQEDVTATEGAIICHEPVTVNENVRLTGCDVCAGQRIVAAGDRLTPVRLAVLASQGQSAVEVHDTPRVAVLTTGDELAEPGQPLSDGQIYNSNAVLLRTLLQQLGVDRVNAAHVRDDLAATARVIGELVESHDFLILTGGVSVGDHDYVKPALLELGIKPDFWRVKIKPGKPLLFTTAKRRDGGTCFIFGLPGNPVSGFVTYQVFVRPALLRAMGAADCSLLSLPVIAGEELKNKGDRPHYLRGRVEHGRFITAGLQQSHALFSLSQSTALLRLDAGEVMPAGSPAAALLF